MVLEDIYSDDPSWSDTDTNTNPDDPRSLQAYGLTPEVVNKLAQPMPIVGPLFGYSRSRLERLLSKNLQLSSKVLGRFPTQAETEALAKHISNCYSTSSTGRPVGLALGIWLCYNTASTYRFPFFTPPAQKFSPEVFPSPEKPWIRGPQVRYLWHFLRGTMYGGLGLYIGGLLVKSYAAAHLGLEIGKDERLKEFQQGLSQKVIQKTQERRRQMEEMQARRRQMEQMKGNPPQPQGQQRQPDNVQRSGNNSWDDDASPTAGGNDDFLPPDSSAPMIPSSPYSRSQQPQQQPQPQPSSQYPSPQTQGQSQPQPQPQQRPPISSWDVVRARAMGRGPFPPSPSSSSSQNNDFDSFSFGSDENENGSASRGR
ncbi:MAG: hypothetical protein M1834_007861 [Cirrosporium novae-zelandiae]|nr:MAG: hypothetical protein M1834_007861 [Cirrosporium novae-zelandiae]